MFDVSEIIGDQASFTLGELARKLGVHSSTPWRWALHGVRGQKLPTFCIGGRRRVSRDDVLAFLRNLNGDSAVAHDPPSDRDQRIERQLDELKL